MARKVSAPVGEPVTLEEAAVVPGDEPGTLGDPAELAGAAAVLAGPVAGTVAGVAEPEDAAELMVEEVQAVNSAATQASKAQAAICRGLGVFAIPMMSNPFNVISGSASHVTPTTLAVPPRLEHDGAGR